MMRFAGSRYWCHKQGWRDSFPAVLLVGCCIFFIIASFFACCVPAWQAGNEQAQQKHLLEQIRRTAEKNKHSLHGTEDADNSEWMFSDDRPVLEIVEADDRSKLEKQQGWQEVYQDVKKGEGIGILEIPAIQAELPVVAGASKEQLKQSEGWVVQSDPIGSPGNAVIAGHRSYTYGRHFNRLEELVPGDSILFQRTDGVHMQFLVHEVLTVEPEDIAVFERPQKGVAQLTLYTCTPVREATHRLIVRARRVNKKKEDDRLWERKN